MGNYGQDIEHGSASFNIDERLQRVLGHWGSYFQEVPLPNCDGVRFGKYGSFLTGCQHSPSNSPFEANSQNILSYNISKSPETVSLDNHGTTSRRGLKSFQRENGPESTTITSSGEGNSSRHDVTRKGSVTCSASQSNHAVPNETELDKENLTAPKIEHLYQRLGLDMSSSSSEGDNPQFYLCNDMTRPTIVELQKMTDEANKFIKEADDLKNSADILKSSGCQIESTEFFFQAALKYLDAASLLDTHVLGSYENVELTPVKIYEATSKLLELCAEEYERCNDMGCAALAYKCLEASNMRIVYSSDIYVRRDYQELQAFLQSLTSVPLVFRSESFLTCEGLTPVMKATNDDNIKNQKDMETTDVPTDSTYSQPAETYPLDSRSWSTFVELLNVTKYANSAMEASRKSQITFGYASQILEEEGSAKIIDCMKRALSFGFHDMKKLVYLVYEAIEALSS